jgi:hypothetical protein
MPNRSQLLIPHVWWSHSGGCQVSALDTAFPLLALSAGTSAENENDTSASTQDCIRAVYAYSHISQMGQLWFLGHQRKETEGAMQALSFQTNSVDNSDAGN